MGKLFLLLGLLFLGTNSSPQQNRYRDMQMQRDSQRDYQRDYQQRDYQRDQPRDQFAPYNIYTRQQQLKDTTQELYFVLSATNLQSQTFHKRNNPDTYVKVTAGILPKYGGGKLLGDLGQSEITKNDSDPQWFKIFKLNYTRGTNQKLFAEVFEDSQTNHPESEVIGDALIDLDEYIDYGHQLTVPLKGSKNGSIIIQNTAPFSFSLELKKLPVFDGFGGLPDPYIECNIRYGSKGRDFRFHVTSTKDNTDAAVWDKPIRFENYIRGAEQMFRFVVKDADTTSADDVLGDVYLDVDAFVDKKQNSVLKLNDYSNATLYVKYVPDKNDHF